MSVPPKFSSHVLTFGPSSSPGGQQREPHTLEFYLDYVCPFSAKQYKTIYDSLIPLIERKTASSSSASSPSLRLVFRHQVQPWHPSSTLTHESALAVLHLTAPTSGRKGLSGSEAFWKYSAALFEDQKEYFDVNVVNETRNETYEKLAKLAAESGVGVEEKKVLNLLRVPDKPDKDGGLNLGNEVTNDLKWLVKQARVTGVHVSPTVLFNGVPENSISSGWTIEQWEEWLDKNVF